ncbi:MAG: anti-sigma regulatory factor [Myxococcota bacterium]
MSSRRDAAVTPETLPIRSDSDVVAVRQAVRTVAAALRFSVVDQTKIVTATSELARNTLIYGGGGVAVIAQVNNNGRDGIRVIFEDKGPGIADIQRALTDGFTTGNGMGLGLGGSRRLVNEFDLVSKPGEGTRVTITRWRT